METRFGSILYSNYTKEPAKIVLVIIWAHVLWPALSSVTFCDLTDAVCFGSTLNLTFMSEFMIRTCKK